MKARRIVTRPDFDGIVCAALLADALGIEAPVYWVEPAEVQNGRAEIRPGDVIANLPYDPRCSLWFDHHYTSRTERPFSGAFALAPSAARVVFDHYRVRFSRDFAELVDHTDRIDAAQLTEEEVLYPEGYPYVMLSLTARNPDRNPVYWELLASLLRRHPIEVVMEAPQVKARCEAVSAQNHRYRKLLEDFTEIRGRVSITDFRSMNPPPAGNRFLVYSLFPEAVVNVKVHNHHRDADKVVVHLGHSIFNRNCRINVGLLLSRFEGGGHRGAGAATFHRDKAGGYLRRIIAVLEKNEPNE
jgi:hypothetical protein